MDLVFNGQLTHYITEGGFLKKINIPVNPGIEILLNINIRDGLSILSGAGYYWGVFNSVSKNGVPYKAKIQEFNLPVLLKRSFKQTYSCTFGLYPGWLVKGHLQNFNRGEGEWYDIPKQSDKYNDENFLLDVYLDIGKQEMIFIKQNISVSFFLKYKFNDYWAGQFRSKINYGIKFSYILNR